MYRRYLSLAPLGWRKPDFDQERLWEGAPAGMAAYFSWLFAFGAGWNLVPKLSEIYVPVLAVSGQFDYLCPAELWESAIGALDDGELVVLDESAHNPQYEQPAAFDAAVLRFVERAWG
jgi:proline iminopeptidase